MLTGAILGIIASIFMVTIRAIVGNTQFDRILAGNVFGTNIVVLIALLGHYMDTVFFIDIALTYALINFIATIAFLRYFEHISGGNK